MKKDLFKVRLFSLAGLLGFMLTLVSCANEEVVQKATNTDNDNDKNLTTFSTGGPESRTSMDYSTGDFYWEAGDYIYVKDDNNVWQKSNNAPTAKTARFSFIVPGKFTDKTSYKVYYPGKNGYQDRVTIPATQTQTEPNTTTHFGVSGDCGVATATRVASMAKFEFKLDHQAAYLVFQPYTSNTILRDCYITKIEVNSDKDIASTYTLDPTTGELTGTGAGKQIVLTTKGSGAYTNGFPLTNTSASVATNGAFVIIKPGTHTLRIRYWVKDVATNIEGTITKILAPHTFDKNKYYDMTANLNVRDYDGNHYYMWDAQQQYWYGYEWTKNLPVGQGQPTLDGGTCNNYAKNSSDLRYYHEGSGTFEATHSCANVPNANEMAWYCVGGTPFRDTDELWTTMGQLCRGGIWLKKKAYISGYSTEYAPNGYDLRIKYYTFSHPLTHNLLPAVSEAGKFFFLPYLGHYYNGSFSSLMSQGRYWSSSSSGKWNPSTAFSLTFDSVNLSVHAADKRLRGYYVQPFSYFGDN